MIFILAAFTFTAGTLAQTPNGQYKPQVMESVQGGEAASVGAPVQLDATPQPLKPGDLERTLKAGEKPADYGKTPEAPLQKFLNRLQGLGEYYNGAAGSNGEYFGKGIMEKCDQAPPNAMKALDEALEFRGRCQMAQRGAEQKIAVNDYTSKPSMMYIFDQHKKCLGKTMVAFGNGAGGAQVACSDNSSHLTPPGFHLTSRHNGGRYNASNSLGMVGLQGQNSVGRGVVMHATRAPGTSSTWGCAGVGYDALGAVMKSLGEGALVYNYFEPQQMASRCSSPAGRDKNQGCQMDAGAPGVPQNATGQGAPAVTQWWWTLIEEAHAVAFPPREHIKKGTPITIHRFLKPSGTYEITMVQEEAVGPNVAAPESLMKALGYKESLADFQKRLERNYANGTVYVLKKDLPLLWEEEIYQLQLKNKRK